VGLSDSTRRLINVHAHEEWAQSCHTKGMGLGLRPYLMDMSIA
jgi:hypothetical protein